MPTMLNYLGYDKPYIAFGKDVLNTPVEDMWAFNWDFYPQYFKGDYVMRMETADFRNLQLQERSTSQRKPQRKNAKGHRAGYVQPHVCPNPKLYAAHG